MTKRELFLANNVDSTWSVCFVSDLKIIYEVGRFNNILDAKDYLKFREGGESDDKERLCPSCKSPE